MSISKPKSSRVTVPDDPDPTPTATADSSPEVQGAARAQKKKIASSYGRRQTILAGNTAADNSNKKTILGG